jgi:pyruvate dehydrogenase E1 component beta subunit
MEIPVEEYLIPIGQAKVVIEGDHVTLVAHSRMVLLCIKAAKELAQRGVRVELIDLRTIKPLDIATIAQSVRKTHHAVLVEEGHYFTGICAEVAYEIQEHCFDFLDAPIKRVSQGETPMPYSKTLEHETMPTVEKIVAAVLESLNIK